MNFKETLAEKTVHAEDVLTKYLPEEKGYQKKVIESMNYSVLAGGKRLPDSDGRELPAVWRELCNCGAFYGGVGNDSQLFPGTRRPACDG